MNRKCICCKERDCVEGFDLCSECIKEIRSSFSYRIGGKEVSKKKFDVIVRRGYVIPEELEERRLN